MVQVVVVLVGGISLIALFLSLLVSYLLLSHSLVVLLVFLPLSIDAFELFLSLTVVVLFLLSLIVLLLILHRSLLSVELLLLYDAKTLV
jgi:hypothetical protein